jgi:hypothetical protein
MKTASFLAGLILGAVAVAFVAAAVLAGHIQLEPQKPAARDRIGAPTHYAAPPQTYHDGRPCPPGAHLFGDSKP